MALRQLPLRPVLLSLVTTVALLLAPSAASAAWTVTPTPNIPGPTNEPYGVDCRRRIRAWQSASRYSGFREPPPSHATVAEHWDGTSWQLVPTPNQLRRIQHAEGVSCPWPNVCFAVGTRELTRPRPAPDRDRCGTGRAGRSSRARTSRMAGSSPSPAPGSWPAPRSGDVQNGQHHARRTLGRRLARSVHPEPRGFGRLSDVSCPLRRTCTAVGQSRRGSATRPSSSAGSGASTHGACRPRLSPTARTPRWFTGCPVRTDGCVSPLDAPRPLHRQYDPCGAPRRLDLVGHAHPESGAVPEHARPGIRRTASQCQLSGTTGVSRRRLWAGLTGDFVLIDERFDGASWQLETIPLRQRDPGSRPASPVRTGSSAWPSATIHQRDPGHHAGREVDALSRPS